MIKFKLNGNPEEAKDGITVAKLLETLNVPCEGTAVAIDGEIILKHDLATRIIHEHDNVDVIRAVGGG